MKKMKKILAIMLCLCMVIPFASCGKKTDTDDTKPEGSSQSDSVKQNQEQENVETTQKNTGNALVLDQKNTVEDYADFTLAKIYNSQKITAPINSKTSYVAVSGRTYVDMVLDCTNLGTEAKRCDEIVTLVAVNEAGTEYTCNPFAVETGDSSWLSSDVTINPQTTVRLHCLISVPESETKLLLKLTVDEKEFTYDYSLGTTVSSATKINVGDTLDETDYAKLEFRGTEYTDDLIPSNTSGYFYTHYAVDDSNNTYLVVKFDITNYMSSAKDCDSFVGVKAVYMDKYNYTGFVVVEDSDGAGFDNNEDISPLVTRHFYYLIEVPKTVIENEAVLTITFHNKDYIFTVQ